MPAPPTDDPHLNPTAPATKLELGKAIFGLRIELLGDASEYGMALVLATGEPADVAPWREWIAWAAPRLGGGADVSELESVRALDEFERTGERDLAALESPEAQARWAELLERLSDRARAVEQLGTAPLGEERGREFGDGVALLGMIEDALALEVTAEGEGRPAPGELSGALVTARKEGAWDFLDAQASAG
jgi:hypothetical protein